MASTGKLAFIIVLMCVIVPIGAGFLTPSDAVERTTSVSGDSIDLTSSLENTTAPVFTSYTGAYNNAYIFDYSAEYPTWAEPVATTKSTNSHPVYVEIARSDMTVSESGWTSWSSAITYAGNITAETYALGLVDLRSNSASDYAYLSVPVRTSAVSGIVTLYTSVWASRTVAVSELDSLLPAITSYTTIAFWAYASGTASTTDTAPLYADPSSGYYLSNSSGSQSWDWYNGFRNSYAAFIVTIPSSMTGSSVEMKMGTYDLYIMRSSDSLYVSFALAEGEAGQSKAIAGGLDTNATIRTLLEIDSDSGTITVTNLAGWNGSGDYQSYMAGSASFQIYLDEYFTSLNFESTIPQGVANHLLTPQLRCVSTRSAVYETPAMENVTIDTRNYWPDNLYVMNLTGTTLFAHSDGPSFNTAFSIDTAFVVDKRATVDHRADTISLGTVDDSGAYAVRAFPVSDIVIASYLDDSGYQFTVNGCYLAYADPDTGVATVYGKDMESPTYCVLALGDLWDTNVTITHMEESKTTEYKWTPGTFNIDMGTYCLIGLATAVLMFLLCGLTGERSGSKVAVLAMVSAICGLVYIVLYV